MLSYLHPTETVPLCLTHGADRDGLRVTHGAGRDGLRVTHGAGRDGLCLTHGAVTASVTVSSARRQVRGIRTRAVMDGHKYICMDREQLELPLTERCLVYSIGINDDWSFDDAMEDFGCQVFAFDPSMNVSRHRRGESVFFQPLGVGDRDETNSLGWRLLTLDSMAAQLGHAASTIHYLKMDVEAAEWAVLRQQAALGRHSTLARVEQLGMELHFVQYLPPERHVRFYRDLYRSLLTLQQLGFYLFSFEENLVLLDWVQIPGLGRNLTTAMEVVWLKSDCARQAAGG